MHNDSPIRLIIVDDHEIVRTGLYKLLHNKSGLKFVGQASCGQGAIDLVYQQEPDVVLLDITMEGMSGLEAMKRFLPAHPSVKVIMLTMHTEKTFFFEALFNGAAGYFLKGSHTTELINAIQSVYDGGIYLPPQLAGTLVKELIKQGSPPVKDELLTGRENEIMQLIVKGLTNREISQTLTVSINTIKTHRLNIYRKLNLRTRSGLVAYAVKQGFLQVSNKHI